MEKPLILAYYLPQFHPIPENDKWWGKGFTEWTNVGRAKPLFKGHYQPRVPADLGYYDLRIPQVREEQAILAKAAGIFGFCYWHYWFNGKQIMNEIIDEVAATGKPDFPFCLGWANESWYKKAWDKETKKDILLIEQTYGGENDYRRHYEYCRVLFENKNYLKINDSPFFLIYKPYSFPDVSRFIELWNKWIKEDGIADSIYFVANADDNELEDILNKGFIAMTPNSNTRVLNCLGQVSILKRHINNFNKEYRKIPYRISMDDVNKNILHLPVDLKENVIPVLYPQWDHSPRSSQFVFVINDSTPLKFEAQAQTTFSAIKQKDNKLIILKSWNEWAEGNYMEPDLRFGRGYIDALRNAINNTFN